MLVDMEPNRQVLARRIAAEARKRGIEIDLSPQAYPSLEELKRLRVQDLYADPERRGEETDRLARDGMVREYELVLRRPDGSFIDTGTGGEPARHPGR